MTREQLLAHGYCCGLGCVNCPYEPEHTEGAKQVKPENADKLSWSTRFKLCYIVLTEGKYDPEDFPTPKEEKEKVDLDKRKQELDSNVRVREDFHSEYGEQ